MEQARSWTRREPNGGADTAQLTGIPSSYHSQKERGWHTASYSDGDNLTAKRQRVHYPVNALCRWEWGDTLQ